MLVLLVILLTTCVLAHDSEICPLLQAKCQASCHNNENKKNCLATCLKARDTWKKPGECPQDDNAADVFGLACLQACRFDAECHYVEKCCRNYCGVTCQQPVGLDRNVELPSRPHDVTVASKHGKGAGKGAIIRWTKPTEDYKDGSDVVYVLEARYHTGRHFSAPRLTEWTTWTMTSEKLKDGTIEHRPRGLKLGTWYEFRVAAVNAQGSRGFSEPSEPFTPAGVKPNRPSQPQHFRAEQQKSGQGTSYILKWDKPEFSDLPVQRYKVYWARRTKQGSLLVHHHTLPAESRSYILKDLLPNSVYFLQVQAVAQFGKARLKSEKTAVLLNTTLTDASERKKRNHHKLY